MKEVKSSEMLVSYYIISISWVKMEAAWSSKMLVSCRNTT
jgi:hypothetical protein